MSLLLAALLIAADQATKWWAKVSFADGGSLELGLGFRFIFVRNTGAAFGLLRDLDLTVGSVSVDGTLLLGLLSAAVSLVLAWYLLRHGRYLTLLPRLALTLVLAGAAGNMIDRLVLGYVVDFIHFRQGSFDFPVFNLADSLVVAGGVLLFLGGAFDGDASDENRAEAEERKLPEPDFFRGLDGEDR